MHESWLQPIDIDSGLKYAIQLTYVRIITSYLFTLKTLATTCIITLSSFYIFIFNDALTSNGSVYNIISWNSPPNSLHLPS